MSEGSMSKIDMDSGASLVDRLEQFTRALILAAGGEGPRLNSEERNFAVHLIESAAQLRQFEFGGSDRLSVTLNKMLEPHQRAALSAARALAVYDGQNGENPFKHDQLHKVYQSEKAFLASTQVEASNPLARPDHTYIGRIVGALSADRIIQDVGRGGMR